MISNQEEATFKGIIGMLAKKVEEQTKEIEELKGKLDGVVTAQVNVDNSLKDFASARRTGSPVQVMRADAVDKSIKDNLTSQLVASSINVNVNNPVASIDNYSKVMIDGLINTANNMMDEIRSIKPRRPFLNLTFNGDKKLLWTALGLVTVFTLIAIGVIIWANNIVASMQDDLQNQPSYWGDRAYQASVILGQEDPAKTYEYVMSHYHEDPARIQKTVEKMEADVKADRLIKRYILQYVDAEDIRVLDWEKDGDEIWVLYRVFDEETERSLHIWPSGKAEQTQDKIVRSLEAARKYSKRKIWTELSRKREEP